jgi:hypothetical protein
MKKLLAVLFAFLLLAAGALAEESLLPLTPTAMECLVAFEPVPLHCGPTQGFYRHENQTIDLTQPFVCFGQDDCWVMAAQGTPEAFGPVGWIEGGLFAAPQLPALSFEDAFSAMIEEDAPVTNDPVNLGSAWDIVLPRGTQVIVLAGYGDFFYIQTEIDGIPARVFVPATAL